MSIAYFAPLLKIIDAELASAGSRDVPKILQRLSVDVFALLVWRKRQLTEYTNLQKFLADLPSEEIQAKFAGGKGEALLPRATFFANYIQNQMLRNFGTLDLSILDYGCGWGRISRLLPYFTAYDKIHLVDPLAACPEYFGDEKLVKRFQQFPALPGLNDVLPSFDICFLFSIFTHTPEFLTKEILEKIRSSPAKNTSGRTKAKRRLLVLTVRPETFWDYSPGLQPGTDSVAVKEEHRKFDYAFVPQSANSLYGDASYGYLKVLTLAPFLEVVDITYSVVDPFQIFYTFRIN